MQVEQPQQASRLAYTNSASSLNHVSHYRLDRVPSTSSDFSQTSTTTYASDFDFRYDGFMSSSYGCDRSHASEYREDEAYPSDSLQSYPWAMNQEQTDLELSSILDSDIALKDELTEPWYGTDDLSENDLAFIASLDEAAQTERDDQEADSIENKLPSKCQRMSKRRADSSAKNTRRKRSMSVASESSSAANEMSCRSYLVFEKYFQEDKSGNGKLDASRVFSEECFQEWLRTRKYPVQNACESFRRAILSHLTGQYGRKPFTPRMEEALLTIVKRSAVWECFVGKLDQNGKPIKVGAYGFRGSGSWERKLRKMRKE